MGDASEAVSPSFAQCLDAARAVRAAEHGAVSIAALRERGTSGLTRSRGPLAVMLRAAALDGRLVWLDRYGFALLEPPAAPFRATPALSVGHALLRLADRQWERLVFIVPLAVAWAVIAVLLPFTPARTAVLVLVLATVLYTAVWTTGVCATAAWAMWRTVRSREAGPVGPPPDGAYWTLPLIHLEDPQRTDELLRRATGRLGVLVGGHARAVAADLGFGVERGGAIETLLVPLRGVTTTAVRERLNSRNRAPRVTGGPTDVLVLLPVAAGDDPADRRVVSGSFALWYATAVVAVLLAGPVLVAGWERTACAERCDGRPSDYPRALRWLSQRLLLNDPPGLAPDTLQSIVFGWLISVMALTGVLVGAVAALQSVRARRTRRAPHVVLRRTMDQRTKLLLLVATDVEQEAVFAAVAAVNGATPKARFLGDQTVFEQGCISEVAIHVARCGQSSLGPSGSALVVPALLTRLRPHFLIMVGICGGLKPGFTLDGETSPRGRQALGDIVVAEQIREMDHRRVGGDGERSIVTLRGDKVPPSVLLLDRLRTARVDWTGAAVHTGLVLSSGALVDFAPHRDALLKQEPDALAVEMEGGGLYAAAARGRTEWILVKGVSDWCAHKTAAAQKTAAGNAAAFVVHMVHSGGLDPQAWQDETASHREALDGMTRSPGRGGRDTSGS
ncbi:5'-methylthioadenosine/S-adenosylhomocysteine nucleosidase family protein [Streptomyces sp. NPDC055254]